jgi:RecB family endonuclease NucS
MISKTLDGWKFITELALENFVWENLNILFDITPFKQQYNCIGEVSDILAIDKNKRLVILELKNVEDRYVIQQLTRYYDNLLKEKPFSKEIDYAQPIRLISIAPSYHKHNLIDQKHSRLDFEFFQFSIINDNQGHHFLLEELGKTDKNKKCFIPYRSIETPISKNIPELPELLIEWLTNCTSEEQAGFIRIRNIILDCHPKLSEIVNKKNIQYGSGKTKLCAEICFHQKSQKPILFLWLPIPSAGYVNFDKPKPLIGRLRIWTDGQQISHVGHIPDGFGKMKTTSEWEKIPLEKRPYKSSGFSFTSQSLVPVSIKGYIRYQDAEEATNFWDVLSILATKIWLEKR